MSVQLRVYYDFASPFCYIAHAVSARLQDSRDVTLAWLPFEVIDYLPPRGAMPQNPAFVRRGEEQRARKLAGQYHLELHLRERLLNSNLAFCAVEHAARLDQQTGAMGSDTALIAALFHAYYAEKRDISDLKVVVDIASQCGATAGLEEALLDGRYRDSVAASKADALAMGVTAVPTWLAGGYGVVGVPEIAALEQLIDRARNAPKPDPAGIE